MPLELCEKSAIEIICKTSDAAGIPVRRGRVRRTSSRFCLGVEHGDYNGTELFGVGTDRFIWFAYRTNDKGRIRLFSENFPNDGVVDFNMAVVPVPQSPSIAHRWARFVYGAVYELPGALSFVVEFAAVFFRAAAGTVEHTFCATSNGADAANR